ncbi:hypothetical protein OIU77_031322 [Salix suchowensis]|uniref:Uncharacterized protein n=1 Tax=Salix suchowensis TaxID=1278906 RepID=A0ABQ9BHF1_9ROSI|nr:hypothetical protein OIU77_031322 [Salix suchowensis]
MINPGKPKLNLRVIDPLPVFPSIEIRESEHSSTLESVHACGNESDAEWSRSRCGPEAQKDRRKEMRPVNDHGDALATFIHTHKDPAPIDAGVLRALETSSLLHGAGQSEKVSSMKIVESIGISSHLDPCNVRLNLCLWL